MAHSNSPSPYSLSKRFVVGGRGLFLQRNEIAATELLFRWRVDAEKVAHLSDACNILCGNDRGLAGAFLCYNAAKAHDAIADGDTERAGPPRRFLQSGLHLGLNLGVIGGGVRKTARHAGDGNEKIRARDDADQPVLAHDG